MPLNLPAPLSTPQPERMHPMTSELLLELAERVEAATGPDRELDAAIYNACPDGPNRKAERLPMEKWGDRFGDGWHTMWADREDKHPEQLKRYTASLDAAMLLVPPADRWAWNVTMATFYRWVSVIPKHGDSYGINDPFAGHSRDKAATPALALCAAALRARAALKDQTNDE
jgi:hypothetical protein